MAGSRNITPHVPVWDKSALGLNRPKSAAPEGRLLTQGGSGLSVVPRRADRIQLCADRLNLDINRSYGRADHRPISASSTPLRLGGYSTNCFLARRPKRRGLITASRDHDQWRHSRAHRSCLTACFCLRIRARSGSANSTRQDYGATTGPIA